MAEPERRRRRPTVSCVLCRRRKIRCNRESPCSNCIRSKNENCVYPENQALQSPRHHIGRTQAAARGSAVPSHQFREPISTISGDGASSTSRESTIASYPLSSTVTSLTSASTSPSHPSSTRSEDTDVESIKDKIRRLEEQLSKATARSTPFPATSSSTNIETKTSSLGGEFHIEFESRFFGQVQSIPRSTAHKARLFGQSHWINMAILVSEGIFEILEPHIKDDTSKTFTTLYRCKYLSKTIKTRRAPPWPCPPTADLPPKTITDELIDCYLRTIERVYRILHVPTFRKDYEALWLASPEPGSAFLVQLKLVLAIGAVTYDDQFSLRTSAIRWVYEAQTWCSKPKFKSRLSIQSLQTKILLLLAEEIVGVGADPIWTSSGALLRTAVFMGLHRDPARLAKRTNFAAEMHRRLWNTILELNLQSSLTLGGPPFLSASDFDTEPPGNFDDDQLLTGDAIPKSDGNFTQTSVAIALRKTFPLRLAVTKLLNDLGSDGTYEATIRLDGELRAAYKTLCQHLQRCRLNSGLSPSILELRVVDFVMHRYLSALHVPFFGPSLHETVFAFSRKVVVESALKIWCAAYPTSPILSAQSHGNITSSNADDLTRLVTCGSGFYRTVAMEATLLIAVELRAQLEENESLSPVILRSDLLSVMEDAKTWGLQCIEAGQSNIKGHLLSSIVAAHIDGLMQGIERDQLPAVLIKAAEDSLDKTLSMLEAMLAQVQDDGNVGDLHQMSLNTSPEATENWGFLMSDALFNSSSAEPMLWMFNHETTQDPSFW
ncbi:hypothetical protein B0J14DRAFT_316481 [Halenospora varia]|nr:hypothetical protein B0J14DRAFT_316481 [Halenospora varia]